LTAILITGCSPSRHDQVIDLVSQLETAETSTVLTSSLDFGTGEAKPHLVYGFHWIKRTTEEGDTFLWSHGNGAKLSFDIVTPETLELSFRCRPNQQLDFAINQLILKVNDHDIGRVDLQDDWSEYRVPIPKEFVCSGQNQLTIGYDALRDLRATRPRDWPLMVGWDWLRVDSVIERPRRLTENGRDSLLLPPGSTASYYLKLRPGSVLETGEITPLVNPGQAVEPTRLEVSVQTQASSKIVNSSFPPGGQQSLSLPVNSDPEVVKLSLSPRSEEPDAPRTTGLKLQPRVLDPLPVANQVSTPKQSRRPNIVLYLVDTLRADHVGCYGYDKPTTPRLDEFAADATLFTRMQAQSSWTKTSVASIVSGELPRTHGVLSFEDVLDSPYSLAEMLREHGYATGGFNTNSWVTKEFGYARGYDHYDTQSGQPSAEVNVRVLKWLDSLSTENPFFLYVHTLDPHDPYNPPDEYRKALGPDVDPQLGPRTLKVLRSIKRRETSPSPQLIADLSALYDGEIASNDNSFGLLLKALKERGLYEDTLIIFVSDHGEEFGEHGWWQHGASLYNEVLNVPLVIRFPDSLGRGRSVKKLVSHVDILPTVLDCLGAEAPTELPGQSLLPMVEFPERHRPDRTVFSTLELTLVAEANPAGFDNSMKLDGIIEDGHKLIRTWQHEQSGICLPIELYDVINDPHETSPLDTSPILQGYLLARIRRMVNSATVNTLEVDPELVKDRLKSLPYL
jgi:arylsulfatase A-like enzyme